MTNKSGKHQLPSRILAATTTLARCGNNKCRAARILGITSKTIYNRLMRYRALGLIDDAMLPGLANETH